ncbi:MAG: N-acetyl-gamma-glutamyl-phosphate reductase [Alphaproteobacteria bacterium]|nr:N-acetyl-gamma-glutamyl-phosphate reductase [Alphaproteobacteria bacterium]
MTAPKIFIDGAEGTTGLMIANLLQPLIDAGKIERISIADRKDKEQRRAAYEAADLTVLCLPDGAAREAITLMQGTKTRVLDASSAHRIEKGWVYGLPELTAAQPELIRNAKFVSNPGCFATGAVSLLRPLIDAGLLDKKECVTLMGVSGYSAGGKKAIARHEENKNTAQIFSAVSLNTQHKHVAEIQKHAGLDTPPLFMPHVLDVPRGMMVTATFNHAALKGSVDDVKAAYQNAYAKTPAINMHGKSSQRIDFSLFSDINAQGAHAPPRDRLDIHVNGWEGKKGEGQVRVTALLDNLGKGAGTQAVQNIKLMLGL